MRNTTLGLKIGAMASVCAILLSGCGSGEQAKTSDGRPIVTVQVIKDARTKKMADMEWAKDLEAACDCSINWEEVASSSWDQQKKAALAAEEVADVTIGGYGAGDMPEYGSLFMDLKPELSTMPNLSKMFKEEPHSQVISTTADGKILGTPTVGRSITARSSNHLFVNKAWLDKLGLEIPTTWDEFEQVLIAFKNDDPNGNGQADEIPFDFNAPGTGGWGLFNPNVLLTGFGIPVGSNGQGLYVENGEVKSYLNDDRYKDFIEFMNKLWKDGVISSEAFTHDWSKYTSTAKGEGTTAKVGVTVMWTPSDIFGSDLADQYVTIPALKRTSDQREKPVWFYNGDDLAYRGFSAVVSNKVANKEAALKLVDAMYSPDLSVQMRYGSFGTSVKRNVENDYTVLEAPEGTQPSDWQFQESLSDGAPGWIGDDMKLALPDYYTEYRTVDAVYDDDFANLDFNNDVLYANMPMTVDQSRTMNENSTGITQNAMSQFAKWVTKGGVDKEWDAYVQSLEKNKLDENIKIEQEVYDSFKKTMKQSGDDLDALLNPSNKQ